MGSKSDLIYATCLDLRPQNYGKQMSEEDLLRILSDPGLQSRVTRIELGSLFESNRNLSDPVLKKLAAFKKLKEVEFDGVSLIENEMIAFLNSSSATVKKIELNNVVILSSLPQMGQSQLAASVEHQAALPNPSPRKLAIQSLSMRNSRLAKSIYEFITKNSELTQVSLDHVQLQNGNQQNINELTIPPQTLQLRLSGKDLAEHNRKKQELLEHLQKLNITHVMYSPFDSHSLDSLLNRTPNLSELTFDQGHITSESFVNLNPLAHLKNITFTEDTDVAGTCLDSLLSKTPALESLTLSPYGSLQSVPSQYPNVRSLQLSYRAGHRSEESKELLKHLLKKFPHLESLTLPYPDFSPVDENRTLKTLRIGTFSQRVGVKWDYQATSQLIKRLSSLKTLEVMQTNGGEDEDGVPHESYALSKEAIDQLKQERPDLEIILMRNKF